MTTPDKKSHWASLANVLGAKVTEERAARTVAPAQPPAEAPAVEPPPASSALPAAEKTPVEKPTAKPKPAATTSKRKDNWSAVLGALGLRTPEPEPEVEAAPEPPAAPPAPVVEKPRGREPVAKSSFESSFFPPPSAPLPKNLWELVGEKAPVEEVSAHEEEISYTEVGGNDLRLGEDDEDIWSGERSAPAAEVERPRREEREDRESREDDEEGRGRRPRRRRRRRRREEAGVESSEIAPVSDARDEDDDFERAPRRDFDEELPVSAELVGEDEDYAPPRRAAEAEESSEERPRRRRRRRRGGRDREAAAEAPEVVKPRAAYDHDDEDEEDDVEVAPRRPAARSSAPPARSTRPARVVADDDHDDDHHDDDHDDDHDEVDLGEHRGIPTWDEAVGAVVSANLDARAKNPNGGRGGRGRGGRGRGGRGR